MITLIYNIMYHHHKEPAFEIDGKRMSEKEAILFLSREYGDAECTMINITSTTDNQDIFIPQSPQLKR